MATVKGTSFSEVYESFLSKITDDMYMQLTPEDTYQILRQLLLTAIHKFEFPRQSLEYQLRKIKREEDNTIICKWYFINKLTHEEINILSSYMITEWIGQQLASVENIRMKYSGSDFKFTSQANHMQKLLQLKKDYERQSFHLQRLYKRRLLDKNGIYRSTFGQIMQKPKYRDTNSIYGGNMINEDDISIENFSLVKGDSFTFDLVISDIDESINISSLYFTVKKRNGELVFQKSLQDGITLLEDLKYRIRIDPQDTIDILSGKYKYDLELGLGDDIYTIMIGTIIIVDDVTKRDDKL